MQATPEPTHMTDFQWLVHLCVTQILETPQEEAIIEQWQLENFMASVYTPVTQLQPQLRIKQCFIFVVSCDNKMHAVFWQTSERREHYRLFCNKNDENPLLHQL